MEYFQLRLDELAQLVGLEGTLVHLLLLAAVTVVLQLLLNLLFSRMHRFCQFSKARWDDVAITALERPLRLLLWLAAVVLGLDLLSASNDYSKQLLGLASALVLLLLTWFLHRLIRGVENELLCDTRGPSDSTDKATVRAVGKLLRIVLWVLAALMMLQTLGVSVSGLLAFGGVGGIAVGFAAKDLLANFFGAMTIYLDRPFTVGDWIRSPDREIEGTVEDVGWRLTRIRTFDQRPLYVPNAVFGQISVENPSRMHNRRIYETIGIRYQDARCMSTIIEQVKAMLEQHEAVDQSKTLIVNFVSFGPSSLDFFIYTFTKTTVWVEFHAIKQEIMLKVLEIIHGNDADVAFPTTTMMLHTASGESQSGSASSPEPEPQAGGSQ